MFRLNSRPPVADAERLRPMMTTDGAPVLHPLRPHLNKQMVATIGTTIGEMVAAEPLLQPTHTEVAALAVEEAVEVTVVIIAEKAVT